MALKPDYPVTKLLLLGTFHFEDRGLDEHKPQSRPDIKTRRDEVLEVVERLSAYRPTKIAVERRADEWGALGQEYRAFLDGTLELPGDEVYQLGFRLAKRLGHSRLYCVNAWERFYSPPIDIEALADGYSATALHKLVNSRPDFHPYEDLEAYAARHGQSERLTEWAGHYRARFERGEAEIKTQTLRETLRRASDPASATQGHGPYVVGAFKIGVGHEYPGVDLITAWYNRNLRIFANLQRVTEPPGERLLVIIGWGHLPILRHCAEASPEYELVEVASYL